MTVDSRQIRAERHVEIGALIQRDRSTVIERWRRRAIEEQPNAKRVHHVVLLDHFDALLAALGSSLAEASDVETAAHRIPAVEHGGQRWQNGWSLPEVVRDYQLLRLVLLEYLDETLERPLRCREVMAVGLALDEAIAASVGMYVSSREEHIRQMERERAERGKQLAEERLRQQAEALRAENERKDSFLATLGHELRNPLAPIRNAIHVLHMREPDAATLAWAKDVVERQVRHMTQLVDELLDVTRIGRGKIKLERRQFDLAELIRTTAADLRSTFEESRLGLTLELPADPVLVAADPVRLTQVVGNLLQNAAKFTDAGGTVTVRLASDPETKRAVVWVTDTGIGIEPAMLGHLFEPFRQAEGSRERSRGGLGLGLALVKGLVELHGGEVSAASPGPGAGSEFMVWLPLDQVPAAPAQAATRKGPLGKPRRILVVDDNRDAADSLRLLLEAVGHQVAVAYAGEDGIQMARHFRPQVVLCDIQMPGTNGYTLAQALKQDPATAGARLLALSGYGSQADRDRCLGAGFERLLTKPVDVEELQQLLSASQPAAIPG
jgi:signal transduction histidine kinase/ActR/RegA family two-component response regulator